ncbi:fibroblast growth factor-binding protein 2-like [Arapaima gigas]
MRQQKVSAVKRVLTLVFLLVLYAVHSAECKREHGTGKQATRNSKSKSVPSSGELMTRGGHRCTWETSGEQKVVLLVNCVHEYERYWCRYTGKPDLCRNYSIRPNQYWKQVVSKLKKKENACEGERILKSHNCKKSSIEAHMKISERSSEKQKANERRKDGVGGNKKVKATEVSSLKEMEPLVEDMDNFGELNDEHSEMEPAETFCAEGWHSFCSFFVRFFDG